MKTVVSVPVLLICLTLLESGAAAQSSDDRARQELCKAIDRYILRIDEISANVADARARANLYKGALQNLISAAQSIYGPSCPCDEIARRAMAHQAQVEMYRLPPAGWKPGDLEHLPSEIDIARHDLKVLQQLRSLCR